jgi:hypothetical protein
VLKLKGVNIKLKGKLFMLAVEKAKVTIYIDSSVEKKLRIFSVSHDINNLSLITEAALLHCLDNRHFINKLTKKEEEIDH